MPEKRLPSSAVRAHALAALAALGAVATGGSLLALGRAPLGVVGVALVIIGAGALSFRFGVRYWTSLDVRQQHVLAILALTAAVGAQYHPLLFGDLPMEGDHPLLVFRAKMLWETLLATGSVHGFSDKMFAGLPAHQMYPVGVDLLIGALKYGSLGLLSWEKAYCVTLLLVTLSYPLSVYALASRASSPLPAVAAGLIAIFDRSEYLQAGYVFNVWFGVLAMALSFACVLWAIWALDRLVTLPTVRAMLLLSLTLAGALVCHPMAIPLLGTMAPLYLASRWVVGEMPPLRGWAPVAALSALIGLGVAAFWLFPFLVRQEWYHPLAIRWQTFDGVLRGALEGHALRGLAAPFLYAGIIGLLVGALRARLWPTFLLLYAGLAFFFATDTALLDFGLLQKVPSLGNLQFERFSYPIRAAVLVGCSLFLQLLHELVRPALRERLRSPRGALPLLALASVVAPYLYYQIAHGRRFPHFIPPPEEAHAYATASTMMPSLRGASAYLNALPRDTVGRIALVDNWDLHRTFLVGVFTDYPVYRLGFTPENNYRDKFETWDLEVWKAIGISHVVTTQQMPRRVRARLERLARFGDLWVYRFLDHSPAKAHVVGAGEAKVLHFAPHAVDVEIARAAPGSELVLHVGDYSLWRASRGGQPLPTHATSIGDSPPLFLTVPATNGTVSFRYRLRTLERFSEAWSLMSMLGVVVLALATLSRRVRAAVFAKLEWLTARRTRVELWAPGLAAVIAVLVAAFLLIPANVARAGDGVITDLGDLLAHARAAEISDGGSRPCRRDGRRARFDCPSGDAARIAKVVRPFEDVLRPCIWLHPVEGARLTLFFDGVMLGDYVEGGVGLEDSGAEDSLAELGVMLDGEELGTIHVERGWARWRFPTAARRGTRGDLAIYSRAPHVDGQHVCFTATTTRAR